MQTRKPIFTHGAARRALALLACLTLLYFAAGGTLLHQHKSGPETVCHVCQSLHGPALTTSYSGLVTAPEIAGWHDVRPISAAPLNEFSLHTSGRAPPSA